MAAVKPEIEKLLRSDEVAALLGVSSRTVTKWATQGKLPCIRTIGGHRRYREADIMPIAGNWQRT